MISSIALFIDSWMFRKRKISLLNKFYRKFFEVLWLVMQVSLVQEICSLAKSSLSLPNNLVKSTRSLAENGSVFSHKNEVKTAFWWAMQSNRCSDALVATGFAPGNVCVLLYTHNFLMISVHTMFMDFFFFIPFIVCTI